jgi:dienelactone hydrolase
MKHWTFVIVASVAALAFGEEDLTVLTENEEGVAPADELELYLKSKAEAHLDRRREAYENIKSQADCEAWKTERREFFLRQIGGLPERTPLNPEIVGELEGDGYRVQKILIESRPNHHVTANLYLPDSPLPYPAVLIPCGHSHTGKAAGAYQRVSILLAKNGMAALCYDPIGQGERYQMLDFENDHDRFSTVSYKLATPHPRVQFLCTTEHTAMGLSCILLGSNVAQFRIWDGMRCIDYLQSRDDIIADKIGCTGNSGGGTLTAYLMALDDRIVAAAPTCYLTTFSKLIETKGPQDAEQNIFGQIAFGMDEPDYVMMRAPKPTLILAGHRDATFNIDGTWDLYRQANRFYSRLGFPERVAINDADAPHGFRIQQREAAARWMHRWLLGEDKVIREVPWPDPLTDEASRALDEGDWTAEELYCSPEGQVLLMEGEKSVFQINSEFAALLKRMKRPKISDERFRAIIRETISAEPQNGEIKADVLGEVARAKYSIEKIVLTPEHGVRLPSLLFVPENPNGEATLYLHGDSMKTDAAPGGPIEKLVQKGQSVLAVDLCGIGETGPGDNNRDWGRGHFGGDIQEFFLAYLIGKSYVGMRAEDISSCWRFLDVEHEGKVSLIAIGETVIPALHAAALHPDRFTNVTLRRTPSWQEIVSSPGSTNQAVNVVHGALGSYTLRDLEILAGEDKVQFEEPVDVFGNPR